jgi:hypothetical protein
VAVPITPDQQDEIIGRLQFWESLISASDQVVAVAPWLYPSRNTYDQDGNFSAGAETMPAVQTWLQAYYNRVCPRATIRWPQPSGCGVPLVEGGVVTFRAQLDCAWNPAAATYQWSVSGASPNGPTNQSTLQVQLPEPAAPVTITLAVGNFPGCRTSDQRTFHPCARETADILYHSCELITQFTHVNPFVNPLGPDVTRPVPEELHGEIRHVAEAFLRDTSQLLAGEDPGINATQVTQAQDLATRILEESEGLSAGSRDTPMSEQDAGRLRRIAADFAAVGTLLQSSFETSVGHG